MKSSKYLSDISQPGAPARQSSAVAWSRIARRIRVPLGFAFAVLYVWLAAPSGISLIAGTLILLPGLLLRGVASGYVQKNQQLTTGGPYAYTRNPLYLGSTLIAAGFAVALLSWPVVLVLAAGFAIIYIPVIASEERFLRATFPAFDAYCRRVPCLIPRLTPAKPLIGLDQSQKSPASHSGNPAASGNFSFSLYLQHREYNASIGAALLYLSLLFLRPAVGVIVTGLR